MLWLLRQLSSPPFAAGKGRVGEGCSCPGFTAPASIKTDRWPRQTQLLPANVVHKLSHHHQRGDKICPFRNTLALCRHPRRYLCQLLECAFDFLDIQLKHCLLRIAQHPWQRCQYRIGALQYLQRLLAQCRDPRHQGVLGAGNGLLHGRSGRRELAQARVQQR